MSQERSSDRFFFLFLSINRIYIRRVSSRKKKSDHDRCWRRWVDCTHQSYDVGTYVGTHKKNIVYYFSNTSQENLTKYTIKRRFSFSVKSYRFSLNHVSSDRCWRWIGRYVCCPYGDSEWRTCRCSRQVSVLRRKLDKGTTTFSLNRRKHFTKYIYIYIYRQRVV